MSRRPHLHCDEACLAMRKETGATWDDIAQEIGYADGSGALHAAQRAKRGRLPRIDAPPEQEPERGPDGYARCPRCGARMLKSYNEFICLMD